MSGIRNSRIRLLTAATTGALALLALTACSDGAGVKDEGSSSNASASESRSDSGSSSGSDSPSEDDAKTEAAGSKSTKEPANESPKATKAPEASENGTGGADTQAVTCEGSNTKTVAAPLTRPVNHMLLTVTNTGSKTCHLYGYPAVRFDEAQSVPPVIEASKPQAVVTLSPGESGYASVSLSATDDTGSNGLTAKSLTVHFQGRTAGEDLSSASPALPAKGVYIDSTIKVSYWQQSMDDAISW